MKVRRCPMCHRANEATDWQCSCGYEFGQSAEKALKLLRSQRRNTHIALFLLLGAIGAYAYLIVLMIEAGGIIVMTGLGLLLIQLFRTVHKLAITRESIRQLEQRALPKAQLRQD